MRIAQRLWLLSFVLALLCGCGAAPHAGRPAGQAVFRQACSACHSLTGVEDARRQGGDLLHLHPSRTQLRQLAAEMPVRRRLTRAQLDAVVAYVAAVERSSQPK